MRKPGVAGWIILALAALGLVQMLLNPSLTWLIPIGIVIILIALYFILPNNGRSGGYRTPSGKRPKIKPSARTQEKLARMSSSASSKPQAARVDKNAAPVKATKKKKNYPFQVIEGRKSKDDEDLPKFH
ncbi:hypothetical protein [Saccharibacillus sp. JS10]|uniref:hypothetical protein n=1 Tax=Saccharibacillus sp. JS10 TaxID=2950552 RepID=UPI00210D89E4|nr:hypothetical protein [Saccharibacillus sp. JS10]MCQ4085894.1 hypothetical protein [Saccharibacillus sp. JS10]